MYKIELTRNGRVIETHPVNSTSDVFQIEKGAAVAGQERRIVRRLADRQRERAAC
jgi:hypothetical protein